MENMISNVSYILLLLIIIFSSVSNHKLNGNIKSKVVLRGKVVNGVFLFIAILTYTLIKELIVTSARLDQNKGLSVFVMLVTYLIVSNLYMMWDRVEFDQEKNVK